MSVVEPARLEGDGLGVVDGDGGVDVVVVNRTPERGHSLAEPAVRAFAEAGAWNAVHADGRKLVVNDETGVVELFDAGDRIDAHPLPLGENRDVLREHLLWYRRLERSAVVPGPGEGPAAEWGPEELRRLRALGYAE